MYITAVFDVRFVHGGHGHRRPRGAKEAFVKRSFLKRSTWCGATLLCAVSATGPATAIPAAAAPSDATHVVGMTSDPDTLFPWKATQFQAVNVLQIVYGTLTEFDQDLNVVPGLAESWEVSEDGLTVTLHLRADVVFNDGSAFDS